LKFFDDFEIMKIQTFLRNKLTLELKSEKHGQAVVLTLKYAKN
jgi:hypothetical protein